LRKRLKKKGREGEKEGLDKEEKEGLDKEEKERRGAGERRIPLHRPLQLGQVQLLIIYILKSYFE
jgi:hypothetical protein